MSEYGFDDTETVVPEPCVNPSVPHSISHDVDEPLCVQFSCAEVWVIDDSVRLVEPQTRRNCYLVGHPWLLFDTEFVNVFDARRRNVRVERPQNVLFDAIGFHPSYWNHEIERDENV